MRTLGIILGVLALMGFVGGPALVAADKDNTHSGTVVSAGNHELVMTGKDGKEHTHKIDAEAKITCNGKECKLSDLKKGTKIKVTMEGEKVTKVEGTTK